MEGSWENGTALFCTWESVLCVFALEPKNYSLFLFSFFLIALIFVGQLVVTIEMVELTNKSKSS